MLQPSASHSALLLECSFPFSSALEFERDEAGEPARYGSAFHSLLAWLLLHKGSKDGFDREVDRALKTWRLPPSSAKDLPGHVRGSYQVLMTWLLGRNPWSKNFLKPKMEVEKSYAISFGTRPAVRSIRGPTIEEHRYEDLVPGEMAGTADLVLGPLVIDHKTGSAETFDSPAEKPQLKTLALVPLLRGEKKPIAGVLHADRRGLPTVYADEVGERDLRAHERALARSVGRIGDGSLRPGPWCARCPAREACPAQHGDLIKRTSELVHSSMSMNAFLDGDDESRKMMKPVDLGRFHMQIGQLEALLKVARQELRSIVEGDPGNVIVRPDGKELALVERNYERLSKSSIVEALGRARGEKELARLRKLGAISSESRMELHAVPGS